MHLRYYFIFNILLFSTTIFSQKNWEEDFTLIYKIKTGPVKNQDKTSTCWSFAGLSVIEAEILNRKGKYIDLSEMFVVKHVYLEKAENYIRFHGKNNFSPGGEFNDVIEVIDEYGIVPEESFNGKVIDTNRHIHGEMDEVLNGFIEGVVENSDNYLSPVLTGRF